MKSNNRFCTYCGVENNKKNKKCIACKKVIKKDDKLLTEYLYNKTTDYYKVKDAGFLRTFIQYVKCHFFGFITTVTLLVSFIICIVNLIGLHVLKQNEVDKVKDVRSCAFKDSKPASYVCEEGYTLYYKKCVKIEITDAPFENTCDTNAEMLEDKCYYTLFTEKEKGIGCPDYVSGQNEYYKLESDKCVKYKCDSINLTDAEIKCNSKEEKIEEIPAAEKYVCPKTYKEIKGHCRGEAEIKKKYYCKVGELEKNSCKNTIIKESKITCEKGYTLDKRCKVCIKEQ